MTKNDPAQRKKKHRVTVDVDDDVWKKAKIRCVIEKCTMTQVITSLLEQFGEGKVDVRMR